MKEPLLSIKNLSKRYITFAGKKRREKRTAALEDISFDVYDCEFLAIVGPSGCGKSTLLNIIMGIIPRTGGKIFLQSRERNGLNTDIGYVTQNDSLLPWRTAIDNAALALELRNYSKQERYDRARKLLEMVGLKGFEDHYPRELSGGMRKRLSIVRTLIYDPSIILMDEPFGPLDAQTRRVLQNELLRIWARTKKTIVFVTHDLVEAISLADRVIVMTARPGRIKGIFDVPIERPRDVFTIHMDENYDRVYEEVWGAIKTEMVLGENL